MSAIGSRYPLAFVLDDDVKVGEVLCTQLSMAGVVEAWRFSEPVQFFKEFRISRPNLVVLDLTLHQSDAVEVIRQLDALQFKGRVLLISGHDASTLHEIEVIGQFHGLHMLRSLQKPIRLADIKNRLEQDPQPVVLRDLETDLASQPTAKVDLAEALQEDWLEVWYQPKIDLKSLTIRGAEALIRARHPTDGIIAPQHLLPAPADPLYEPLSLLVLHRTMADWSAFSELGFPLKLAINVPASVLCMASFVDAVRRSIPRSRHFPGLIIELTEHEIVEKSSMLTETIAQLKLHGASISIDDFGSAHSSFSRVKDLSFCEIKLDRGFVANCGSDLAKRSLCQTVADLAHRLDASACAEGVETMDDLRCLLELGFDTAQGYLFAKPMPRQKFCESLLSNSLKAAPAA